MKIYVDELPKSCAECEFCGRLKPPAKRPEVECMHCNLMKKMDKVSEFCPLQLADLNAESYCLLGDKKMTYKELYFNSMEEGKKLYKQNQFLKDRWEKLKSDIRARYDIDSDHFLRLRDNESYHCLMVEKSILDTIQELEKESEDETGN